MFPLLLRFITRLKINALLSQVIKNESYFQNKFFSQLFHNQTYTILTILLHMAITQHNTQNISNIRT